MSVLAELRQQYPKLFNQALRARVQKMIEEAIEVEMEFCKDALSFGVTGLSETLVRQYLQYVADERLTQLGFKSQFGTQNPFSFMVLQDIQPLTNFFEKRVTEYQKGLSSRPSEIVFNSHF